MTVHILRPNQTLDVRSREFTGGVKTWPDHSARDVSGEPIISSNSSYRVKCMCNKGTVFFSSSSHLRRCQPQQQRRQYCLWNFWYRIGKTSEIINKLQETLIYSVTATSAGYRTLV